MSARNHEQLSMRALLERLGTPGLETATVERALEATTAERPPWYVRVLIGGGTWVGASMIALFLMLTNLMKLFTTSSSGRVIGGTLFLAGAAAASRRLRGDLATQLTLICSLVGQGLWLWAISSPAHSMSVPAMGVVLLQCLAIAAFPDGLHRFLSTVVLVGGLTFLVAVEKVPLGAEAITLATVAAAIIVWLAETRLCVLPATSRWWRPVAYGLVVSSLGLLLFQAAVTVAAFHAGGSTSMEPEVRALLPRGMAAPLLGCAMLVILTAAREAGRRWHAPPVLLALAGAVAVGGLTWNVPGVMAALVFLAIGQLRGDRVVMGLALTFLGCFLFLFYYQMDTTLLAKSLWIVTGGAGFLVLRGLIHYASAGSDRVYVRPGLAGLARPVALMAATALVFGIVGAQVMAKERILARGQTVLLKLAPRDPRALMMGDYMALRYEIARDVAATGELPVDGFLVIAMDERGIARFVRLHDEAVPLASGELLLRYRRRDRDALRLGAERFFFEEGQADRFANARYGEIKLDPSGESVLVGLRGDDLTPL